MARGTRAAAEILTELQELLAPLAYARFNAEEVQAHAIRSIENLRKLGVDESLLGTIDLQVRVILGMETGDPSWATTFLVNEIANWKQEHCGGI